MSEACKEIVGGPKIGTCGFGLAQADYARVFSCVEVQHTFYQPPPVTTLERWRARMPDDFEFVLKAWQLITHDAKSPTYRRLKRNLSDSEKEEAGYFRNTAIVREAWDTTVVSAKALRAKTILFQCPASFKQNEENIANLEMFIRSIDRQNLNLCWEPRGNWDNARDQINLSSPEVVPRCRSFHWKDDDSGQMLFPASWTDGWRYQYESGELEELAAGLSTSQNAYVFFNNSKMTQDALKFCELVHQADDHDKFLDNLPKT